MMNPVFVMLREFQCHLYVTVHRVLGALGTRLLLSRQGVPAV